MNELDDLNVWLNRRQFSDDLKKCLIHQMHLTVVRELRQFSWFRFSCTPGYQIVSNEEKQRFAHEMREGIVPSRGRHFDAGPSSPFVEDAVSWASPARLDSHSRVSSPVEFLWSVDGNNSLAAYEPGEPLWSDLDNDDPAAPVTPYMFVDVPNPASNLNWEAVQRVAADADRRTFLSASPSWPASTAAEESEHEEQAI